MLRAELTYSESNMSTKNNDDDRGINLITCFSELNYIVLRWFVDFSSLDKIGHSYHRSAEVYDNKEENTLLFAGDEPGSCVRTLSSHSQHHSTKRSDTITAALVLISLRCVEI